MALARRLGGLSRKPLSLRQGPAASTCAFARLSCQKRSVSKWSFSGGFGPTCDLLKTSGKPNLFISDQYQYQFQRGGGRGLRNFCHSRRRNKRNAEYHSGPPVSELFDDFIDIYLEDPIDDLKVYRDFLESAKYHWELEGSLVIEKVAESTVTDDLRGPLLDLVTPMLAIELFFTNEAATQPNSQMRRLSREALQVFAKKRTILRQLERAVINACEKNSGASGSNNTETTNCAFYNSYGYTPLKFSTLMKMLRPRLTQINDLSLLLARDIAYQKKLFQRRGQNENAYYCMHLEALLAAQNQHIYVMTTQLLAEGEDDIYPNKWPNPFNADKLVQRRAVECIQFISPLGINRSNLFRKVNAYLKLFQTYFELLRFLQVDPDFDFGSLCQTACDAAISMSNPETLRDKGALRNLVTESLFKDMSETLIPRMSPAKHALVPNAPNLLDIVSEPLEVLRVRCLQLELGRHRTAQASFILVCRMTKRYSSVFGVEMVETKLPVTLSLRLQATIPSSRRDKWNWQVSSMSSMARANYSIGM